MARRYRPIREALRAFRGDREKMGLLLEMVAHEIEMENPGQNAIGDGELLGSILRWIAANPEAFKDLIKFIVGLFS